MEKSMEMEAYEAQINLPLLNDIATFVVETAKANYAQKETIINRCILWDYNAHSNEFQQKYGFLYLGELLERYESRFGMSVQDRRAIALALGFTSAIATKEMFVGNQRTAFLQGLHRYADEDVYLTGALYLLNEGQSAETSWLERLCRLGQEKTEELIFVMSLFSDFEQAVLRFKPQLIQLLGCARTMDLQGNMGILSRFIGRLQPVLKTLRGSSFVLLRALCALPVSFVKEESRYHKILLEHKYTPFEIVYANIMAVQCYVVPGTLSIGSIVTVKIVIDLFRRVLSHKEPLPAATYTFLSELFIQYDKLPIRCYGYSKLLEALNDVSSQVKWAKFRHKVYQCRGEVSPGGIPAETLVSNGLVVLQSVAGAGHVNDLTAVDEAVKDSGGNGSVAKEVGPLVKALVGSNNQ